MKEEFYIGYQAKTPDSHSKWIKKFLMILIGGIVLMAVMITIAQKTFSKGVFNYGNQTELEGFIRMSPVPHLQVYNDKGLFGENIYKSVILTGAFKFGAEEIVKNIFKENNISITNDSTYVKIKGTLIYNDGKALFELTDGEKSLLGINPIPDVILNDTLSNAQFVGGFNPYKLETVLKGEIIDPKCYFGAMKPGHGKTHKSCAVRCISGGIPPVLKVDVNGNNEYYILYGEDGKSVNKDVLDYVAEPVEITGHFEALDDWFVLYIEADSAIRKL